MDNLDLENPFWRFSLHIYGAPGVAEACLNIQDQLDVDVNVLLFCAWVGTKGVTLSEAQIAEINALVHRWNTVIVKPLRAVRRACKDSGFSGQAAEAFRPLIAADELKAEQIEQAMLYAWSSRLRFPDQDKPNISRARANLVLLLAGANEIHPPPNIEALLTAAEIHSANAP